MNEKELIDRINAKLKNMTFPLEVSADCFICGKPATGYVIRSENPLDRRPVCNKCGKMVSLAHYRQGRNVVIMSADSVRFAAANFDFAKSVKRGGR